MRIRKKFKKDHYHSSYLIMSARGDQLRCSDDEALTRTLAYHSEMGVEVAVYRLERVVAVG